MLPCRKVKYLLLHKLNLICVVRSPRVSGGYHKGEAMRIYIGIDDTDTHDSDFGTGKLVRRLEKVLPKGCHIWGVVRQQLLVDDRIPYTSHNSSACAIVNLADTSLCNELIVQAIAHLERESAKGSDPGLCIAREDEPLLAQLISLGHFCTQRIVTQKEVLYAADGIHLSGHGGTNEGIIGAAAAVGLTASGWCGRFIEFGSIRDFPQELSVADLERAGIQVVSLDRDTIIPDPSDIVNTRGWLRPRLWGFKPVLPVLPTSKNRWESIGGKRNH